MPPGPEEMAQAIGLAPADVDEEVIKSLRAAYDKDKA
jgi:hypothetical protein